MAEGYLAKRLRQEGTLLHKTARLSPCGTYRYQLGREWGSGIGTIYGFIGINPSTADADLEDATTGKWRGLVERWDGDSYKVANLYAYRATDVRDLAKADDPRGPGNLTAIHELAREVDVIVPCWGSLAKVPRSVRSRTYANGVLKMLKASGKPVKHLGLTKGGYPRHPLMLSYSTRLEDFA